MSESDDDVSPDQIRQDLSFIPVDLKDDFPALEPVDRRDLFSCFLAKGVPDTYESAVQQTGMDSSVLESEQIKEEVELEDLFLTYKVAYTPSDTWLMPAFFALVRKKEEGSVEIVSACGSHVFETVSYRRIMCEDFLSILSDDLRKKVLLQFL